MRLPHVVLLFAFSPLSCAPTTPTTTGSKTPPPPVTIRPVEPRPTPPSKRDELTRVATEILHLLVDRKWSSATARFDAQMAKALPDEKLAQVYEEVRAQVGELRDVTGARVIPTKDAAIVDLECAFQKENLVVRVVLDESRHVAGLFFKPGWSPPDYADARAFEERALSIGSAKLPLPATLTIPRGSGPFPALVLVHGSGPNDRDETMGPNKIFKDLAWGLASRQIAVLRFVKRTEQYRGELSDDDVPTAKEESLDDVRTAVDALEKTAGVDPRRVFIAGHSLGAMLAPRIAQDDPRVRGILLFAGPTRPEGKIIFEQTKYLMGLAGKPVPADAEPSAKRLDSADLRPDEIVEGIAGRYWIDLRDHHGVRIVDKLTVPILVLQGGRDYQVTTEDFEGWKKALAGKTNATLKLYPNLNHHFMSGKGRSTPAEYGVPNHVPLEVVDDVASWIRGH